VKRCPTCQSTYTNDALRFCLQDGAALVSVSDATRNSAASEETLEISGGEMDISREPSNPHAAATVRIPAPTPTAVEQQSFRPPSMPEPQPVSQGGAPPRQTNTVLVAGVTAIAVLLLVLVGIGIALLMRGRAGGRRGGANEATVNASPRSDNEGSDASSNANQQGRARRPDMTGELSAQGSRVEAKILRGASVNQNDIAGLSRAELRRLRNTVYARHGRIFERMELQQYFDGRPWYKKRADYTDDDLSPVDRDNINLIRAAEDRSP
jgi:YARHG domain